MTILNTIKQWKDPILLQTVTPSGWVSVDLAAYTWIYVWVHASSGTDAIMSSSLINVADLLLDWNEKTYYTWYSTYHLFKYKGASNTDVSFISWSNLKVEIYWI